MSQLYHDRIWQTTNDVVGMNHRPRTSHIRVLGKSMYMLSAGWIGSVAWLWIAEVQQFMRRHGEPPPSYALSTLSGAVIPSLCMLATGWLVTRWAVRAPDGGVERREWWHSFWWCLVPNLMLIATAWVMIQEAR